MKLAKKALFCTCHSPEHTIQLTVMQDDPEDLVWFSWMLEDGIGLLERIKLAFRLVFTPRRVVLQETAVAPLSAIELGATLIRDVRMPKQADEEETVVDD